MCTLLPWSASVAAAYSASTGLTNIFAPESTPAKSIFDLSIFVLAITGIIFAVVFTLLVYAIMKFRATPANAGREPAQVYGSTQIELAWTIIPVLIVVVLFLATARVIHAGGGVAAARQGCPCCTHRMRPGHRRHRAPVRREA